MSVEQRTRMILFVIGLLITTAFVVAGWREPVLLTSLRLQYFDLFQRLNPRPVPADPPVLIVDIDEESLDRLGQWPWSRQRVGELVRRLSEAGAAGVAFDVIFAEEDRLSPPLVASQNPDLSDAVRAELSALPPNEEAMIAAFSDIPVVLGMSATRVTGRREDGAPPGANVIVKGEEVRPYLIEFPGVVRNIPALEKAADGIGMVTVYPESDGIVRRIPALYGLPKGAIGAAMSLELIRAAGGFPSHLVRMHETGGVGIQSVVLRGESAMAFEVPTDPRGLIWVHFSKTDKSRYVPAWRLLAGQIPPGRLAGKLILVGTSAQGLLDIKSTPVDASIPGVEVHAQIIEQVLEGSHLTRPAQTAGAELFHVGLTGLALAILVPYVSAIWTFALLFLAVAISFGASWYLFADHRILLDGFYPAVAATAIFLLLTSIKYLREESERRKIRTAFSFYLSPVMVDRLAQSPQGLKLGGELRELTVLFADLRGFTAMSENFGGDAEQLTRLINRYFTAMTRVIMAHEGTIDKYIGDAIMAFWNAPLPVAGHPEQACRAALEMLAEGAALNKILAGEAHAAGRLHVPLSLGVGLNTGEAYVGNLGSEQRFNYSVLGDTVNTASRIEGQTKSYGTDIVIGEATQAAVPEFACLELDRIRLKGKSRPVKLYGLFGDETLARQAAFQKLRTVHGAMLAAYDARNWQGALRALDEEKALAGAAGITLDPLIILYQARISQFMQAPPPADWDGVFDALSK